jgi:hypothetical protein
LGTRIAALNPEGFEKAWQGLKAQSDARTAEVESEFARPEKELGLAKSQAEIRRQNAEIGRIGVANNLTRAQIQKVQQETANLGIESRKKIVELEGLQNALNQTGGVDPETQRKITRERFDLETKLRGEISPKLKSFDEATRVFNNIRIAGEAGTAQGDIALVTSFMKMLDPGSVVRETEFAIARDTLGLYQRLNVKLKQLKNGEFLTNEQRQEFTNLARQYYDQAGKLINTQKQRLEPVITDYELKRENIFGAEPQQGADAGETDIESILSIYDE